MLSGQIIAIQREFSQDNPPLSLFLLISRSGWIKSNIFHAGGDFWAPYVTSFCLANINVNKEICKLNTSQDLVLMMLAKVCTLH